MTDDRSLASSPVRDPGVLAITLAIVCSVGLLYHLLPTAVFYACVLLVGGGTATIVIVIVAITHGRGPLGPRSLLAALAFVLVAPSAIAVDRPEWDALALVSVLFTVALALVFFYYVFFVPLALYDAHRADDPPSASSYPSVSVLVPAYNEEGYVGRCIDSIRAATYPGEKEIVVIDDGSTDGTRAEARERAENDPSCTVVSRQNGGKYAALNYGLLYATGEVIVVVDADSRLAPDALEKTAAPFERDPDVGAVAGNVVVSNTDSLVSKLQALEYVIGIQVFRRAFSRCGAVTIVPGALGAFRRSVLDRTGGYDPDTLTEDFDVTVKALKAGYTVTATDARCYTEAPGTWRDLYNQRLRWYRGNFETLLRHRDVFTNARFGVLYGVAFPLFALSMVGLPIAGLVVLGSAVLAVLSGAGGQVISAFGFFVALQTLFSLLALRLDDRSVALALYAPLFVFGYRQVLDVVILKSIFDVCSGRRLTWTRATRERHRSSTEPGGES